MTKGIFAVSEFFDDYLKKLDTIIKRSGHAVQLTAQGDGLPFMYTIGRAEKGLDEFIMFGALPPDTMRSIINGICNEFDQAGHTAEHGEIFSNEGQRFRIDLAAGADQTHMNFARARLESVGKSASFDPFQIIWPDTQGRFPDDEGYETKFVQPLYMRENPPKFNA